MGDVFLLFMIPVGGGIPAGVLLAKTGGMGWMTMMVLYFISDVLLAICFEPLMIVTLKIARHVPILARAKIISKQFTEKAIASYGASPGPFMLIMIAFGVDPMTGRAAALSRGHGFFAGWAIAIAGDLLFFFVVMLSTLCLNNLLGDGTWTSMIILVLMFAIPTIVRRLRKVGTAKLS